MEAFVTVGAWINIEQVERSITLPELIHIVDMGRSKRHQDYDIIAQIQTGESIGQYSSMTDLDTIASSRDSEAISGFEASHLPVGLGYVSE